MGKFNMATPDTSGVTPDHLQAIHAVAKAQNCFIFIRPSTPATMRLIQAGFATKSMDIHDKSSDWGLTAGFVPCDQSFSKKQKGNPNPTIHPHGHGEAVPVELAFSAQQWAALWPGHFEGASKCEAGAPCWGSLKPGEWDHIHHDSRNKAVCQFRHRETGKVYWRPRTPDNVPKHKNSPGNGLVPLFVWGYKGVAVTGDYDLWMVVPHISRLSQSSKVIDSVVDKHGRSAAMPFTMDLIGHLNTACKRTAAPVFNHGAEAQNYSFTQELDRYLCMVTPGAMPPVMVPRLALNAVMHDMLGHGYVVVRNPKWISGTTLGVEDMAHAPSEYVSDRKMGQAAVEEVAANKIIAFLSQRASSVEKSNPGLGKALKSIAAKSEKNVQSAYQRYYMLWLFRAMASIADSEQGDILLPPEAFPPGSARWQDDMARKAMLAIEETFGRQGFTDAGGHAVPIDGSSPSATVRPQANGSSSASGGEKAYPTFSQAKAFWSVGR